MTIQPEGEHLRKAIRWISDQRRDNPHMRINLLIEQACIKFDLSPADGEFLYRFIKSQKTPHRN